MFVNGPIVNKPVYMDDGTIIAGSGLHGKPGKRIHVERSTDNGETWPPETDATLPNNNSALDAVTLNDGRHLLVYNQK